jgi:hypothetical protein
MLIAETHNKLFSAVDTKRFVAPGRFLAFVFACTGFERDKASCDTVIRNSGSESRGISGDAHGAEIRSAILDAPPVSTDDLIRSDFTTRASHTFVFDEKQCGKTVWFRLRWENMRGQKGPWSELYSAIIP